MYLNNKIEAIVHFNTGYSQKFPDFVEIYLLDKGKNLQI